MSSTCPHVWRCPSKHTTPWIKPSHVGTHGDTCHSRKSHPRLDRVPKHATEIALFPAPSAATSSPSQENKSLLPHSWGAAPPPETCHHYRESGKLGEPWAESRGGVAGLLFRYVFQLRLFHVILGEAPRLGRASSRAARSQPALFWVWRMPPSHRERVWLSDRTACRPAP